MDNISSSRSIPIRSNLTKGNCSYLESGNSPAEKMSINGKDYDFSATSKFSNSAELREINTKNDNFVITDQKDLEGFPEIFNDTIVFKDKNNKYFSFSSDEIDIKSKMGLPKAGDIISFVDCEDNKFDGEVIGSHEDNDILRGVKQIGEFFHDLGKGF